MYNFIKIIWSWIKPVLGTYFWRTYVIITRNSRRLYPTHYGEIFDESTEIMIEAHARSANSFAVRAFRIAQQKKIRIAHHFHQYMHVKLAADSNIPILIILRDPDDVVVSNLIHGEHLSIINIYFSYYLFHKKLHNLSDKIVFATFDQVINDFDSVISRLNIKFSTNFLYFSDVQGGMKTLNDQVNDHIKEKYSNEYDQMKELALPSDRKETLKINYRKKIDRYKSNFLRNRSYKLFYNIKNNFCDY